MLKMTYIGRANQPSIVIVLVQTVHGRYEVRRDGILLAVYNAREGAEQHYQRVCGR